MKLLARADAEASKAASVLARGRQILRAKLPCPYCRGHRSKVVNSRSGAEGDGVWRRRECLSCGKRYTTEEVVRGVYARPKSTTTSGI